MSQLHLLVAGRPGAGRRLIGGVLLALGLLVSCSSSDGRSATERDSSTGTFSTSEETACGGLQDLVDAITGDEAEAAMVGLTELERSLAESDNGTLVRNGATFFTTINGTVPDAGNLTPEQSAEVGDQALSRAQPALSELIAECGRLGLPIENLPVQDTTP